MSYKKFKIPFAAIILTLGIVLGIQIEKVFSGDSLRESIIKFNEVLSLTEKYYVEEVDTQKLVEAAINGMLGKLDPHSVYIPAKQMETVEDYFKGNFEGIGIEFQIIDDTLTVIAPISGGPSEQVGILAGDKIVEIEGKEVIGITNQEVRDKLMGNAGTKVNVTVVRSGLNEKIIFEITRAEIPLYSVDTHFMLDNKTGYISVSKYSETTYDEVKDALDDLKENGMKQLILDLRGNPGGYLNQAFRMADLFIEGNKKIVYTRGRRSEFNEEYYASEPSPYEKIPLIILVNKGSASASEIVSGAVQDWDRGLIVGETTFGKGLVQRQFLLPDNSAVRLTISEYFTPAGRLIQRDYKNVKDRDEYYSEVNDRDESEGENINHAAEKDTTKPVHKTNAGRIVYGGGGITPDYIVKSNEVTKFTTDLISKNIFYLFALSFIEQNDKMISEKYDNDLSKFKSGFLIDDTQLNNLIEFAKSKDVPLNEDEFKEDKEYIRTRLKAQIARHYWKNKGWYSVILESDNQVKSALNLFDEAKDLAKLK